MVTLRTNTQTVNFGIKTLTTVKGTWVSHNGELAEFLITESETDTPSFRVAVHHVTSKTNADVQID
jgi:hypothetical protein